MAAVMSSILVGASSSSFGIFRISSGFKPGGDGCYDGFAMKSGEITMLVVVKVCGDGG